MTMQMHASWRMAWRTNRLSGLGLALECANVACEDNWLRRRVCSTLIRRNWSFQALIFACPAPGGDLTSIFPILLPELRDQLSLVCSASNPCVTGSWKSVNSGSGRVPRHNQRSIHF
ncbi:hypothetical protein BJV78DRAFT_1255086 [Lactifluus subvellereus]|nr:hypothetical protein BJV78DRAFT_1255086 [Lactifluus subvellereus]